VRQLSLSYAASLARTFGRLNNLPSVIEPMVPTVGYFLMTEPLPIADISDQPEGFADGNWQKAEREECAGLEVEELIVHANSF